MERQGFNWPASLSLLIPFYVVQVFNSWAITMLTALLQLEVLSHYTFIQIFSGLFLNMYSSGGTLETFFQVKKILLALQLEYNLIQ